MKKKNGFTLIELLAVIAVIAILTIIAVPNVLKLYKESKKNTFIAEVRKTAKSAQLEYAEGTRDMFDCNEDVAGQKYKECTGTVDEDEVTITALGDGAFSNFLMVDVTSEPDSGIFIDLDELNLIEIEKLVSFKESLIKDNAINPIFRSVEGKEIVETILEIELKNIESQGKERPEITDEIQQRINEMTELIDKMRNNNIIVDNKMRQKEQIVIDKESDISYSNGTLKNNLLAFSSTNEDKLKINSKSSRIQVQNNQIKKLSTKDNNLIAAMQKPSYANLLVYELNVDSKMLGTYEIIKSDFTTGAILKESDLKNIFESGEFAPSMLYEGQTIDLTAAEKVYFIVTTEYGEEYEGFTIEKTDSINNLQLIGKSSVELNINDIKSYVDDGIKNKNAKLTNEGDFYSYNNIRQREGNFTYNYVVKTNDGVKILKRKVNVYADTPLDCFDFYLRSYDNSYDIRKYYEYEKNDKTQKACPKRVYIPNQYNNYNITSINYSAFKDMGILSVRLPEKLETIGYKAFSNNFIETLTIPKTVKKIERFAFLYNNIKYIEYKGSSKFCNQSIGPQRYNKIISFEGMGYSEFWYRNIYTGKTSKSFLKSCTLRPPE